jgi:hypothetical protein
MLQLFLFLILLLLAGIVACLAALTDPNSTPNPNRQLLFPIGLSILLGIGGALMLTYALAEVVGALGGSDGFVGVATMLAGFGLSGIAGGVSGLVLGFRYNRRLR